MAKMSKKANYLANLIKNAGLLVKQADQKIEHKDLNASQPTVGNKMQKEIQSGTEGNYASDKSVDASITGVNEATPASIKVEGSDSAPAASVLRSTGTTIDKQDPAGDPKGLPGDVVKSAGLLKKLESAIRSHAEKEQYLNKQAALASSDEMPTATGVMNKIASLQNAPSEEHLAAMMQDISQDFVKLASENPLFNVACEHRMMAKMAAEIDALAEAEGIPQEDAAALLDAAIADDPAAAEELNNEVQGEALSDLAAAEEEQAGLMDGLADTAAQVSEMTGQEITPDDIVDAVDEVCAAAEEMGVEPEVLIQAAAEEMMNSEGDDVTEEDMAQAEELVNQAAAEGVSPEELIEGLAGDLGEGEGGDEGEGGEAVPEKEPDDEEAVQKTASLYKLASSRRGANLNKILNYVRG